jgi:hypothetical protein
MEDWKTGSLEVEYLVLKYYKINKMKSVDRKFGSDFQTSSLPDFHSCA